MNPLSINKSHKMLYGILLLALFSENGYSGVMIGGTRFIYHQDNENGLPFLVRNSGDSPVLIQTKILPDDTKGNNEQQKLPQSASGHFVATPPLLPLKKQKENYIRIIRTEGKLPDDRESLFQLSVAVIPSGKPTSNDLQIAIRSRYKLLYRPDGLKGPPEQAYQMLNWQKSGESVKVENPTPYYVTLFQLSVNGKVQSPQGVVSPFGSRTESWCPKTGACQLQWQSLDDNGMPTKGWVVMPQSVAQAGKPFIPQAKTQSERPKLEVPNQDKIEN